jgi:hypothetical protein
VPGFIEKNSLYKGVYMKTYYQNQAQSSEAALLTFNYTDECKDDDLVLAIGI